MTSHANFILSTCGISLLTNKRTQEQRSLVNKYSNYKTREEISQISPEDAARLDAIIADVRTHMSNAPLDQARRMSAELNGLLTFYKNLPPRVDHHHLICTDTWLGETAARVVENWLKQYVDNVTVIRQTDLQTASLESFQVALAEIVQWCESTLPGYRDSGYHIVFNLTGGFKSIQGFFQTLGLFYADETVYIFESQDELLRIPRLPVRMDREDAIRRNLTKFRRLSRSLPVTDVSGIPETLLMQVDGECTLSAWGELVWNQTRRDIYSKKIYPPPSDLIRCGPQFERSIPNLAPDRRIILNERLDDLSVYLEKKENLSRLDFKQLRGNPRPPSTHECDAWADQDARRIFGHFEGPVFVLDELGKALH